jgi:hemolysin-activating ACP:hemolysin acyltransferase
LALLVAGPVLLKGEGWMLFRSKTKAEPNGSETPAPSAGKDGKAGQPSGAPEAATPGRPQADVGKPAAGNSTPSTDEAQRRVASAIRQSLAFAQIVPVLMRSPHYRHYSLGDLEWLVIPPLLAGQYRLAEAKQNGVSVPAAVALWARVSAEVDKKLSENLHVPIRLRPDEWQSGDILWLIDVVGDQRVVPQLLKQLGETAFKGREAKVRARGENGKVIVQRIASKA